MEKAGEHKNFEVLEKEQKEKQERDPEVEDESDSSIETGIEGVKIYIREGHLKGKHISGAQKRKMKKLQATAAGQRGLPETGEKKRKQEEVIQNSETSNGDTKKLKTNSNEKEAPVQQSCALQKVRSSDITDTSDAVTEELHEKGTCVVGQKPVGGEEMVSCMTYAVVLEGFPGVKMTEDQAEMVETALMERIKPSVQFSTMQYENGGVALTCVNNMTKAWLFKTVHSIVPWPGARLEVGQVELLLKGTKCILWVTTAMTKRSNRQILDLLQKQNKDISVANWKVLRRVAETAERERLTLWVDSKSFEDLQVRNFKLFLGLGQANLMLPSEFKTMMVSGDMANFHNPCPALQKPQGPTTSKKRRKLAVPKITSENAPHSQNDVNRGSITNASGMATEEVNKNGTSNFGQESEVQEEIFDWLRVAVVLEGYPDVKMTEEQVEMVGTALMEWIISSDEGEPIQFSTMEYESGALVLTCVNEKTKTWIKETVRAVSPWPGARLVLGQAEILLKGTKFILWVTGMKEMSNRQILDVLQNQNKGISTTEWVVFKRVTEGDKKTGLILWVDISSDIPTAEWKVLKRMPEAGKRERLILWVGNKSSDYLKARGLKLFLGFSQVKLMPMSDWKKLMETSGCTRRTYKLRSLIPDSGPRAVHQSRERVLPGPNPRPLISGFRHRVRSQCRDVESANVGPPHVRKVQCTTSGRRSPRESTSTDPAVLQNLGSIFPASAQPREHTLGPSEWSQLQEASYCALDRMQHTEHRNSLDLAQRNKYLASVHSQPCDIGYETQAPPLFSKPRFEASHQVMRYTASDQAQSCDSRYVPLNQKQSDNLSFRGWNQSPSLDSRFTGFNESHSRELRFGVSNQARSKECRFVEGDSLYPPESNLRLSNPKQFRQFENTVSRVPHSQLDKFPGSHFPVHQSRSCYTTQMYSRFSRPSDSSRNNS